ncbi:MAG TPA: helix-turn-helix domain-containing protein [Aldersonia sp.]
MAVDAEQARSTDQRVRALAGALLDRVEEIAVEMTDRIFAGVDFYGSSTQVSRAEVTASCAANTTYVFRSIRGESDIDVSVARATGEDRARAGAPLSAVMAAYRIGFRFMSEQTLAQARRDPGLTADAVLDLMSHIFISQDEFTQAMAEAYREVVTARALGDAAERAALVEALLAGRITDSRSLWEVGDALRIPTRGPYVVVAARVPELGRIGLPEIRSKLYARDIRSAWRLEPDFQVGIAHLGTPDRLSTLISVLRAAASSRVGVSPPFDDLVGTGEALRYARLATSGRAHADSLVEVFDESPLTLAAVSAPEVMTRVGRRVLAPLDDLPVEERRILVDTLEAWLDTGGSANETAAKIFCHPNTVRHRLRRIEERTGKSLTQPRDVAELCLALEIERQLPRDGDE